MFSLDAIPLQAASRPRACRHSRLHRRGAGLLRVRVTRGERGATRLGTIALVRRPQDEGGHDADHDRAAGQRGESHEEPDAHRLRSIE